MGIARLRCGGLERCAIYLGPRGRHADSAQPSREFLLEFDETELHAFGRGYWRDSWFNIVRFGDA